jgi:ATP-dependent exoDNAse (exonuclease V) beta subunit
LALDAADRPAAVAATSVADLPDPAALALSVPTAIADAGAADVATGVSDDEGRPAGRRPGSGTAFGIAVHAVLERVPLDAGRAVLAETAVTAATEQGMADASGAVERAARAALSSAAARAAAAARHWREVFVGAAVAGTTVEGFVDLLYEDGDGLVVVDWKTDAVDDRATLAAKVEHYGLQLATYAEALSQVTGRPVIRCVMVFCGSGRAREVEVPDLAGRRADVRSRLAALAVPVEVGS